MTSGLFEVGAALDRKTAEAMETIMYIDEENIQMDVTDAAGTIEHLSDAVVAEVTQNLEDLGWTDAQIQASLLQLDDAVGEHDAGTYMLIHGNWYNGDGTEGTLRATQFKKDIMTGATVAVTVQKSKDNTVDYIRGRQ